MTMPPREGRRPTFYEKSVSERLSVDEVRTPVCHTERPPLCTARRASGSAWRGSILHLLYLNLQL